MSKAKFIGKTYDKFSDAVYLFYEYRGHEYMIVDMHNGYSEPLWVMHKNEQESIDREIEDEKKPVKEWQYKGSAQEGFDIFMDYVEGV